MHNSVVKSVSNRKISVEYPLFVFVGCCDGWSLLSTDRRCRHRHCHCPWHSAVNHSSMYLAFVLSFHIKVSCFSFNLRCDHISSSISSCIAHYYYCEYAHWTLFVMQKRSWKIPDELKLSFALCESPESSVYRWKIVVIVRSFYVCILIGYDFMHWIVLALDTASYVIHP